jgi:hypothetical protein
MILYCREKHLLVSLYVVVYRFVSVAAYFGNFRENLLGKPRFVKIWPKLLRCLNEDLSYVSMYSVTLHRHKNAAFQRSLIRLFI